MRSFEIITNTSKVDYVESFSVWEVNAKQKKSKKKKE